MAPLRILYVITKANWGGAQRYVYDLATAAKADGHTVRVISGAPGALTQKLEDAGVETVSLPSLTRDVSLGQEWKVFKELQTQIRTFQPDVVHGNSSKAGGLAALAARLHGHTRSLFTAHGWAFNEQRPWWQRVVIWLMHYATVLLADRTICVSEAARRDTRLMPLVRHKVSVIHNGVGNVEFKPRDEARVTLAPNHTHTFWIGTIAELHPTKQLSVLLRAFAQLQASTATLVLMGEGQERERLTHYAKRLGIADRVVFCGHVAGAASYLPALDIFVLPSRSEGLAYVLLEAGQARLPVIASRVGGIPEIIQHGVTGALTASGDAEELATTLTTFMNDPELRVRLATALEEKVRTRFSVEEMVSKTLALY